MYAHGCTPNRGIRIRNNLVENIVRMVQHCPDEILFQLLFLPGTSIPTSGFSFHVIISISFRLALSAFRPRDFLRAPLLPILRGAIIRIHRYRPFLWVTPAATTISFRRGGNLHRIHNNNINMLLLVSMNTEKKMCHVCCRTHMYLWLFGLG